MSRFRNAPGLKKHATLWIVILLLSVALTACTQPAQRQDAAPAATPTAAAGEESAGGDTASDAAPAAGEEGAQLELTLEELAEYNGKDGKPA